MRLIDADELKKAYEELTSKKFCGYRDFEKLIDNAPTVEPPNQLVLRARDDAELEQLKTAWGNGEICFTPIVAYTARPQGEWIEVTKGIDSNTYKCPFCGRLINCDKPRLKLYPFCHCGADMRGKKNE